MNLCSGGRALGATLLFVAAAWLITGCGDDETSTDEAADALCADLEEFSNSLTTLTSLDPGSTTIDGLKDATTDARDQLAELADSARDVADALGEELQRAYEELVVAAEAVDESTTVSEAVNAVRPAIADVRQAWSDVVVAAGCHEDGAT